MGKYEPLTAFLQAKRTDEVPMSFAEIEQVLGGPLPASKARREWWSNNPSNNVLTKAWLAAGYRTERVDLGSEQLVFRRVPSGGKDSSVESSEPLSFTERVQAALGGTVKQLVSDEELMAPLDEGWKVLR